MAMSAERTHVVGVFESQADAERAIDRLRAAGFGDDQIGVAMRHGEAPGGASDLTGDEAGSGAATGAVTGGVIGGLLGAAAAALIPGVGPVLAGGILAGVIGGVTSGAVAGGLLGALVGLGIPEEEAGYYNAEFEAGRVIVTVRANGRPAEAERILREAGAGDLGIRRDRAGFDDSDWAVVSPRYRAAWEQRFGPRGGRWEDWEPQYRYAWEMSSHPRYQGRPWADVEPDLRRDWEARHADTPWEQAGEAVRETWENVTGNRDQDHDRAGRENLTDRSPRA
ncbi:MAG TPA: general stress protein [Dehalococcoidia bacterium]|nr:general stress protein [Dehalococcoidia bacterium]